MHIFRKAVGLLKMVEGYSLEKGTQYWNPKKNP